MSAKKYTIALEREYTENETLEVTVSATELERLRDMPVSEAISVIEEIGMGDWEGTEVHRSSPVHQITGFNADGTDLLCQHYTMVYTCGNFSGSRCIVAASPTEARDLLEAEEGSEVEVIATFEGEHESV